MWIFSFNLSIASFIVVYLLTLRPVFQGWIFYKFMNDYKQRCLRQWHSVKRAY
nr:MAG TPA: hypothetical protein [Caudoviricetes sp.]